MPKTPIPEDPRSTKQIVAGIGYILEEIRDLKRESAEDRRRADEERRRADEDRRRADERHDALLERMDEGTRRADERHAGLLERIDDSMRQQAARDKDLHRAVRVIGFYGRKIIETQTAHTRLLQVIAASLKRGGNGSTRRNGHGNGRGNGR